MQTIPDNIEEQYPAVLKKRMVPVSRHADYRKWLRYYLDEGRHIVGIEILDASERLEPSELVNITIENIPIEKGGGIKIALCFLQSSCLFLLTSNFLHLPTNHHPLSSQRMSRQ